MPWTSQTLLPPLVMTSRFTAQHWALSEGMTDPSRTTENAINSPLLRLPAELRNKIWAYAYGNAVVHVRSRMRSNVRELQFRVCPEENDPHATRECCSLSDTKASVPLVSKQLWFEATGTFMASNTLVFDRHYDFYEFALLRQESLSRLSRLLIRPGNSPYFGLGSWATVSTSSILGRFNNLQGVRLLLQVSSWDISLLRIKDVMRLPRWRSTRLPAIIRAFQQHPLKNKYTYVKTVPFDHYGMNPVVLNPVITSGMEAIIKVKLLEYHPRRRLSWRGQDDENA
jgi:hypothetical protein